MCHELFFWQNFFCCLFLLCSMLSLAIKLHQHLFFQRSHFKSFCSEAMLAFIFAIKQYLHLHSLWSRTIICLCNEAALALFFCHKAASTFYLYWGHIYTSFIPKLCQHPFFPWSHDNTSFASKSWSYVNNSFLPWSHDKISFTPKLCQRSSLSWNHDNTPH